MGTASEYGNEPKPEVLSFLDWLLVGCVGVITACVTAIIVILVFALEPADVARIEAVATRMAK